MKKLLTTVALATTITMAHSAEVTGSLQKIYELPGLKATEIEKAYGPTNTLDAGNGGFISNFHSIDNIMNGQHWKNDIADSSKGKIRCDIAPSSWMPTVNSWVEGHVVLQTKDERARITVELHDVHGPGKETCLSSIEQHLDNKFKLIAKLDNDW